MYKPGGRLTAKARDHAVVVTEIIRAYIREHGRCPTQQEVAYRLPAGASRGVVGSWIAAAVDMGLLYRPEGRRARGVWPTEVGPAVCPTCGQQVRQPDRREVG